MTEKTPTSPRSGQKALKEVLGPIQGHILLARVLAVIASVLAIAPYVAFLELARLAAEGADRDRMMTVGMWLISAFCLRLLIYFIGLTITHFGDIKLGFVLRQRMINRLASAPLGWFTDTNSGRFRKSLHDDIAQIHQLVAHAPVDMTIAVVQPVVTLVFAFFVDYRLGLLAISAIIVYALTMMVQLRGMGDKTMEMDHRLGDVSATMLEFARGITVVKAFGVTGQAHGAYRRATKDFSVFYRGWCGPLLRLSAIGEAIVAVPLLLAINIGVGTLMVQAGWVSFAEVLTTTLIALTLPACITTFATAGWSYQLAGAAAHRIVTLLHTEQLPAATAPHLPSTYDVRFDDVSFSYRSDDTSDTAIDHVSFALPEGTVTALIGPSGSGKSTCACLLARFFDPTSGAVTIGGVDVASLSAEQLYRTVSFVLQNPKLIRASLHDNIALGRPDATRADVEAAAKAARIHDDILALPDGYDSVYGEEIFLSGGQAQRVAIARALLIDAPVLVLDEATAYADPENEALIQQALSTLARGRTVLVIGHRPEAIRGVDQVVVLESGRLVASGTPAEVAAVNPYYAALAG
ncbi:ABC transporter ATP-binding protein [Corynebacterium uterequi]|uniref:ABC-type multidrug transport system, ATPase and permease component n=1 Tax=Corynebacterium uterequi TaxID=1072256 RepID=A0A0G3HFR2_9CORY|nr:ABC transporter ATP-binding protein [Corynebacterium uterequi]AKK12151.1 ABC-type multidrug transport system, ATPase and permease component [Corynebacterium uterequi]